MKYFIVSILLGSLMFGHKSATNISNSPGCSGSASYTGHSVAVDSKNRVHFLWIDVIDTVSGAASIYYKHSLDGGTTLGDTMRLTGFPYGVFTIATNNIDLVHIFWADSFKVNYRRSFDGGDNWQPAVTIDSNDTARKFTSITLATSGANKVYAAWLFSDSVIRYSYSTDSGSNWQQPVNLGLSYPVWINPKGSCLPISYPTHACFPFPSISASDTFVHVVWHDSGDSPGNGKICYKRSTDGGVSWDTTVILTTDNLPLMYPSVASSRNHVYIGWIQSSGYGFIHSPDNGANWDTVVGLTGSVDAITNVPQLNAKDNFVALIFSTDWWVKLVYSKDFGATWSSVAITPQDTCFGYATAAIDDSGYIHMVWTDVNLSNNDSCEVYYSKYSLLTGVEEKSNIKNQISKLEIKQNPFIKNTTIEYYIPAEAKVSLEVYDLSGRCVKVLVDGQKQAGNYSMSLNAKDLTAGIYFVTLNTDTYKETKKLILMK